MQKSQYKLLFLSSLGGILEFYDFIIYGLFASYISNAFFPETNPLISLMITFATFAIGYLARPLGGIIFGHFGDRIGRKTTFTFSILMMALSTIGIGFIPSYSSIGIFAPIMIISLRMTQGFSLGGEIPGSLAYVSESLSNRKGLACGIIFAALNLGIVLGFVVQALVVNIFSDTQMQSFGWRIPFILGGILGLCSYLLRRELNESPSFLAIKKDLKKFPIISVFKEELLHTITGVFLVALSAAIVTTLFLFIPAYFTKILHLSATSFIWQRTAAMGLTSLLSIIFGLTADFVDVKKLIFILGLSTAFLAYPIFAITAYYPQFYFLALLASAYLAGLASGTIPTLLSQLFPTNIRYSGIAASYNLGFAIFGGLAPFISLSLIYLTDSVTIPALYLILMASITNFSLFFVNTRDIRKNNFASTTSNLRNIFPF